MSEILVAPREGIAQLKQSYEPTALNSVLFPQFISVISDISVLNHEGEPVHTTQTICKLHERNAREEVLNSSQFIKLQKVKVKTDRAFGICRCITAHSLRGDERYG